MYFSNFLKHLKLKPKMNMEIAKFLHELFIVLKDKKKPSLNDFKQICQNFYYFKFLITTMDTNLYFFLFLWLRTMHYN